MRRLAPAAVIVFLGAAASAQAPPHIAFQQYLNQVGRANLELAAQRAGVSVTEAQIAVARVFPDPQLTVGVLSVDVSGAGSPAVVDVALQQTIELGGKRGARVAAARQDLSSAQAALDDFLRTLRADASDAFIDALAKRMVLERKRTTLASVQRLVTVNQERLRAGDIGEVALIQSRVEAGKSRGEVLASQTEVAQADLALALRVGSMEAVAGLTPAGDLHIAPRTFDIDRLIATARNERPDVRAKRFALEAAKARVRLAHANRWIDISLNLGWAHSFASSMSSAFGEQVAYDAITASLTLPLPFSRVYKGELTAARFNVTLAEWQLRAAELHVEVEIRQAWSKYETAVERLRLYDGGLLKDADRVLEAKLYEYQRGGAPLLEVLVAQRTVNDVYLDYIDALADHARALVALEQAAGIWDFRL